LRNKSEPNVFSRPEEATYLLSFSGALGEAVNNTGAAQRILERM
jgi:hypothetical protein